MSDFKTKSGFGSGLCDTETVISDRRDTAIVPLFIQQWKPTDCRGVCVSLAFYSGKD